MFSVWRKGREFYPIQRDMVSYLTFCSAKNKLGYRQSQNTETMGSEKINRENITHEDFNN